MLLVAVPDESYCLKTNTHSPARNGTNVVCYRCGMLLGMASEANLGTMLDY